MSTVAEIAKARLANVDAALEAARIVGVEPAIVFALMDMESEGANIWGGDAGGTNSGKKGDVTEADFKSFAKKVAAGAKSNGVGVLQITHRSFFPQAEKQGLKLWVPLDNIVFGLKLLKTYLDMGRGIEYAGTRYNGKATYGKTFERVVSEWRTRLAKATDEEEEPVAKGLSPAQLRAAFKKWGVKYAEHADWETHNRNGHGAWAPNGIILHHTGDDAPDSADEKVVYNGRSDLPGPLCHWGMRDDGTLVLIGNGRANHAGQGSGSVLAKVISENYSGNLKPGQDNTDGNVHFYGQETFYSGSKAPTKAAYENTLKAFAAVCDAHGWGAKAVIGHKEWTARKPDPGHVDMATFRNELQALLDAGPGKPTTPAPSPVVVDLSNVVKAAKTDPDAKDGTFTAKADVLVVEKALVAEGLLSASLADGHFGTATITAYAAFQRSAAGGNYSGADADGIPGSASLAKLGKRHGFTVKA